MVNNEIPTGKHQANIIVVISTEEISAMEELKMLFQERTVSYIFVLFSAVVHQTSWQI